MDETYIKVKGEWVYFYRAVDKYGNTIDFKLSENRDEVAARKFFQKAINYNDVPERVVIDKSGANLAGIQKINAKLKFTNLGKMIEILQVKHLNNIVEQDHRFIKKVAKPMMGFKALHSAKATLAGIEVAHMIRKAQLLTNRGTGFQQFAELAG